jgi:tRNA dimethylallyltransferase
MSGPEPGGAPPLICVVGPTGVGKSDFALELAEAVGGEIVNADSRQVYRGMDIGTAKPTAGERARVPHHLLDVVAPGEPFSAGRFVRLADAAVADIRGRSKVPVVVGGTGLYVRALVDGFWNGPPGAPRLRAALAAVAERRGAGEAHRMLRRLDPASAAAIHPNDAYKAGRALEVTLLTGRPASALKAAHGFPGRYEAVWIGLTRPRAVLYERIDRRVDRMLESGWVEETRRILEAGTDPGAPGMNAVGYREIARFLRGEWGLQEAAAAIRKASRNYAKRQFTWFLKDARIQWLEAEGVPVRALVGRLLRSNQLGVMRVDVSVRQTP